MGTNKVIIKGLNKETSENCLELYLEQLLGEDDDNDFEVKIKSDGTAVIIFQEEIKDVADLQEKCNDNPLDNSTLRVLNFSDDEENKNDECCKIDDELLGIETIHLDSQKPDYKNPTGHVSRMIDAFSGRKVEHDEVPPKGAMAGTLPCIAVEKHGDDSYVNLNELNIPSNSTFERELIALSDSDDDAVAAHSEIFNRDSKSTTSYNTGISWSDYDSDEDIQRTNASADDDSEDETPNVADLLKSMCKDMPVRTLVPRDHSHERDLHMREPSTLLVKPETQIEKSEPAESHHQREEHCHKDNMDVPMYSSLEETDPIPNVWGFASTATKWKSKAFNEGKEAKEKQAASSNTTKLVLGNSNSQPVKQTNTTPANKDNVFTTARQEEKMASQNVVSTTARQEEKMAWKNEVSATAYEEEKMDWQSTENKPVKKSMEKEFPLKAQQHIAIPKKDEKLMTEKIPVQSPRVIELLKQENVFEEVRVRYPGCTIKGRENEVVIQLTDKTQLAKAKVEVMERVRDIESNAESLPVSPGLKNVFYKNKGLEALDHELHTLKKQVLASVKKGKITFYSVERKHVQEACKKFKVLFDNRKVPLPEGSDGILDSEKWKQLVSKLHSEKILSIFFQRGRKDVEIVGIKQDVDNAASKLKAFIDENNITELSLDINPDLMQYFEKFGKNKLMSDAGANSATTTFTNKQNRYIVKGKVEQVKAIKARWDKLSKSIQVKTFTVTKPGMGGFLTNNTGQALIKDLETKPENKGICISVKSQRDKGGKNDGKPAIAPKPQTAPSGQKATQRQRSPSPKRHADNTKMFNNIKLTIVEGDISKQKADVLVNSCSRNVIESQAPAPGLLRMFGSKSFKASPTTMAFINQGGNGFIKDLESIKANLGGGDADYGSTFLTNASGSIQADCVINAVCPPRSKAGPSTLSDMFTECFKEVNRRGKTSVGIPALGSGNCGFSTKEVWDAISKALYSSPKQASLKFVTLVVFGDAMFTDYKRVISGSSSGSSSGGRSSSPSPYYRGGGGRGSSPSARSDPRKTHKQFGNIRLDIKQGDISKVKDDVLVNILGNPPDLEKSKSVISQAFLKMGGPQLDQEVKSNVTRDDDWGTVIVTPSAGKLQCRNVIHAICPAFKYDHDGKTMQRMIGQLLAETSNLGLSGLSLPPLGTGRLNRYPEDVFYRALDASLQKCSSLKSTIQNVTLYVFDDSMFKSMIQLMNGGGHHQRAYSPPPYVPKSNAAKVKAPRNEHMKDQVGVVQAGHKVDVSIVGFSSDVVKAVEKTITQLIDQHYKEEKIKQEHMTAREVLTLMTPAQKSMTFVEKTTQSGEIILRGEKTAVVETANKILRQMHKNEAETEKKFKKGTKDYLLQIADSKIKKPSHWKTKIIGTPDKTITIKDAKILHELDILCTSEWVPGGRGGTWKKALVGHGADAVGLSHNNIQIKTIERIENEDVYRKYMSNRQILCRKAANGHIRPIGRNQNEPYTSTLKVSTLESDVIPEINECYLFHGAKAESVKGIINQGADNRMSGKAMMGNGIYMAESSTKADQYADAKTGQARPGGDKRMFLMRVALGNVFVAETAHPYTRPPCLQYGKGCDETCKKGHPLYDSVLAYKRGNGQLLNFREFIVYDGSHVYPEYLITYERK